MTLGVDDDDTPGVSARPGALEGYASEFDALFRSLAGRRGLREYLTGLLAARERNKTLTALAGAEPVAQAQHPAVQRLQYFLSESAWNPAWSTTGACNCSWPTRPPPRTPAGCWSSTAPASARMPHATAHVGQQYLGSVGKTGNGVVIVSTLWADERVYSPLHLAPYTPAGWFPAGNRDEDFTTKPQLAADLVEQAVWAHIPFAAVVADSAYGPVGDLDPRPGPGRRRAGLRARPQTAHGSAGRHRGRLRPGRGRP